MIGKISLPNCLIRCDPRACDFFDRIMGQQASAVQNRETMITERRPYSFFGTFPRIRQNLHDIKKTPPPPYGPPPPSYSPAPVNPNTENLGPKAATEAAALQRQPADEEVFIMGNNPCQMQCYHCGYYIATVVRHHNGFRTHLCSCLMCCSVCLMPFFWLPYIQDTCKDIQHYCPVCGMLLGTVGF